MAVSVRDLTFVVMIVCMSVCDANKTAGYFEYKYSLQRELLLEKEKEFSGCCPKLTQVNIQIYTFTLRGFREGPLPPEKMLDPHPGPLQNYSFMVFFEIYPLDEKQTPDEKFWICECFSFMLKLLFC